MQSGMIRSLAQSAVTGKLRWVKEAATPAAYRDFRRALAATIRIITSHRFIFPVSPDLLPVFITFVGGNHHADLDTGTVPDGFHHMDGSHHIGLVSLNRYLVGKANQRLGRQMEHDVRPVLLEYRFQRSLIANIHPQIGLYLPADARQDIIVPFAIRIKPQTDHFRA